MVCSAVEAEVGTHLFECERRKGGPIRIVSAVQEQRTCKLKQVI
jgi:hypothetical protein